MFSSSDFPFTCCFELPASSAGQTYSLACDLGIDANLGKKEGTFRKLPRIPEGGKADRGESLHAVNVEGNLGSKISNSPNPECVLLITKISVSIMMI
jgi:hypothetical protein